MALIRRDQSQGRATAGVRLELGDLSRQGDHIRELARREAESIISEARKERERIIAGAREEAYAKGLTEGRNAGRQEGLKLGKDEAAAAWDARFKELHAGFTAALTEFQAARERMLQDAEQDVLELAILFARKALKQKIEVDLSVIREQLAAVLEAVARPTALVVRVHPDDAEDASGLLPALLATRPAGTHATIQIDPSLTRGSVVATTAGGGVIDASIQTQVQRMAEAMFPAAKAMPEERRGAA